MPLTGSQARTGAQISHDVAVPVAQLPGFLEAADAAVLALMPSACPVPFAHLGDGNVHYKVLSGTPFLEPLRHAITGAVHDIALDHGGTILAEHGIGQLKRDAMPGIKSATELDLMTTLKRAIDAKGLMNPG